MTPKHRLLLMVVVFGTLVSLVGFMVDHRPLNNSAFVLAVGVDQGAKPGLVRLNLLVGVPGSLRGEGAIGGARSGPEVLVTMEAPTIAEAYALARKRVGRYLDVTHTRVILVSDQIAQGGLSDTLGYLIRVENLQHIAYVGMTRGPTTAILQARPRLSGGLAFYLLEILTREGNRTPQILPVYLWNAFAILNEPGQDLTLPIFAFDKQLASQVEIEGTALFHGDRMVGSLTGEDTRFLSLLMNQEVTVGLAVAHNSGKVVMRIERARARNRLTGAQGANPTPAIDLKARLVIEQMTGVPLLLPTEKRALEERTAASLAREAERVLGLMQAVGSDPIGFGRHYYNAHGGRVDMTKWGERYRQVRFLVRARTTLQRTNFLSR